MNATSKDFTMKDAGGNYNWMSDGIEDVTNVKQFVRDYVRGTISGWAQTVEIKASEETIYKTWRSGSEFVQIVEFVKMHITE